MRHSRVFVLTLLAMLAFAGNSLLCRAALADAHIDPASFTAVRLVSGAVLLWVFVTVGGGERNSAGNWVSAIALFAYAAGFSFSYVHLTASAGALILWTLAWRADARLAGCRALSGIGRPDRPAVARSFRTAAARSVIDAWRGDRVGHLFPAG